MRVIRLDEPDDPRVAEYRAVANPRLARRLNLFVAESRLVVERALARDGPAAVAPRHRGRAGVARYLGRP